jgi:hypothetical protein
MADQACAVGMAAIVALTASLGGLGTSSAAKRRRVVPEVGSAGASAGAGAGAGVYTEVASAGAGAATEDGAEDVNEGQLPTGYVLEYERRSQEDPSGSHDARDYSGGARVASDGERAAWAVTGCAIGVMVHSAELPLAL